MNSQNPKLEEANKWISNRKMSSKTVRESITPYKEQLHLPSLQRRWSHIIRTGQASLDSKKPTTGLQGRKNIKIKNKNKKQKTHKNQTSLQLCYTGTGTIPGIYQVRQQWIPDHSLLSLGCGYLCHMEAHYEARYSSPKAKWMLDSEPE